MTDVSNKLDHQPCAKCGHERGKHRHGICHAQTADPPFSCLCAGFQEPEGQEIKRDAMGAMAEIPSRRFSWQNL